MQAVQEGLPRAYGCELRNKAGSNVVESAAILRSSALRRMGAGRSSPKACTDTEHAGDDTTYGPDA